jgi:hypothetical protein
VGPVGPVGPIIPEAIRPHEVPSHCHVLVPEVCVAFMLGELGKSKATYKPLSRETAFVFSG